MKIGNKEVSINITTMIALTYASSQGVSALELIQWLPRKLTPLQYIGLFAAASGGQVTEKEVIAAIDADTTNTVYGQILDAVINEVIDPNSKAEMTTAQETTTA
ncbi:MAG TPA: hypothetical protein PKD51_10010 [Saprospiraceae bacterium]|nr:hypothetical protein [Saprospiraceae bacterium]HMU04592.1 hypothetical protein [Saprospiraceae bacterium]